MSQERPPERVFGRRYVLGMFAGAAALAACGGTTSSANGGSTGSSRTTGAAATGDLEGPAVPAANRIPAARLTAWTNRFAGTWQGAWKDDTGATGTADASVSADPTAFVGRGTLSISDGFFGPGTKIAPANYQIDLTKADYTVASAQATSPQFGAVDIAVEGFGATKVVCTAIPGHPDIDKLEIDVQSKPGNAAVSITYTITRGTRVTRGAMTANSSGTRPPPPEPAAANTQAAFIGGDYAASLVSAAALTKAIGINVHAPVANGGKTAVSPGVNVSNARADTDNPQLIIQYSIYRGTDPATARAFLDLNKPIATPIDGLGDAAYLIKVPVFLQVLQGNEVAEINIVAPPGTDLAALDRAVAEAILPKLGRS